MNRPSQRERLLHIQKAIALIQSFVKGQTENDFVADIKGQNAVLYQFLIIGEAIRHVDDSLLSQYKYPWHIPKSFRNFIAHEYHKIRIESVYRAAIDLNELDNIIALLLKNEV